VFAAGGRAVPPNEVSVRVRRTRVGTVMFGVGGDGDEQRPTADDDGDQPRAGHHHHRGSRPCIISVYRGSASRQPSCRRVGVRVTTRRCRCVTVSYVFPTRHPRRLWGSRPGPFAARRASCAVWRRGWRRVFRCTSDGLLRCGTAATVYDVTMLGISVRWVRLGWMLKCTLRYRNEFMYGFGSGQ